MQDQIRLLVPAPPYIPISLLIIALRGLQFGFMSLPNLCERVNANKNLEELRILTLSMAQ